MDDLLMAILKMRDLLMSHGGASQPAVNAGNTFPGDNCQNCFKIIKIVKLLKLPWRSFFKPSGGKSDVLNPFLMVPRSSFDQKLKLLKFDAD